MNLSQTWQEFVAWIAQHWLLGRLFISSLELLVLAALAAIALQLLRPRTPRLVALVWALVLAKPILSLLIASPISLLQLPAPPEPQVAAAPAVMQPEPNEVRPQPIAANDDPSMAENSSEMHGKIEPDQPMAREDNQLPATMPAIPSETKPVEVALVPAADRLNWVWSTLTWLWLAGLAVMIVRSIFVRRQLARIFAACREPLVDVATVYQRICSEMNIRRAPPLAITNQLESPALVGLWRARILLPEWLAAQAGSAALAWSLRHELTHWRHGDLWLIRLRELARAVFFFHPAAWWAGKQLETAIEIACDRAVIATDDEAADYAHGLYKILDAVRNHRRVRLSGGLFATRSQIARRLATLMEAPLRLHARLSRISQCGIAILAISVLTFGIGLKREVAGEDAKPNAKEQLAQASPVAAKSADNSDPKAASEPKQPDTAASSAAAKTEPVKVTGHVVDENDKPVGGVKIQLFAPAPDAGTTTSAADGTFSFTMKQKEAGTLVAEDAPGKRLGYWMCFPVAEEKYAPKIVLKPERELTIKVVNADGKPVEGATFASPSANFDLCNLVFNGKTNAEGKATFKYSDTARICQIVAYKSGAGFDYVRYPVDEKNAEIGPTLPPEITLKLTGARTVRIKAADQNKQPIAGVAFNLNQLKLADQKSAVYLDNCNAVKVLTDAAGVATFDWLPKDFVGQMNFRKASPGFDSAVNAGAEFELLSIRQPNPKDEINIELHRRGTIAGHVFLPDGKPAAGIHVYAGGMFPNRSLGDENAITAADGSYSMGVRSEAGYVVVADDPRYGAPAKASVAVHEGKPVENLDFKLAEGTIIRGAVTEGSENKPVGGQQVRLDLLAGPVPAEMLPKGSVFSPTPQMRFTRTATTDASSKFRFCVGPGDYWLVVPQAGLGGVISSETPQTKFSVNDQREIVQDCHLSGDDSFEMTVKVVDAQGKQVQGARLNGHYMKRPARGDEIFFAKTTDDGTVSVKRAAIPAVVSARSPDGKQGGTARMTADQKEVSITLVPLVQATGKLLDEKGQPAAGQKLEAGIFVRLEIQGASTSLFPGLTETAADGSFTVTGLLPGEEYTLRTIDKNGRGKDILKFKSDPAATTAPQQLGDVRPKPKPDQNAITTKGKLLDADGKPVVGTTVYAYFQQLSDSGARTNGQAKPSAEGEFEIKRPAVPAVLTAHNADFTQVALLRLDAKQTDATLKYAPLTQVHGRLVDADGKPVADGRLNYDIDIIYDGGYRLNILPQAATTAADGTFTLKNLIPGEEYQLRKVKFSDDNREMLENIHLKPFTVTKAEGADLGDVQLPKTKSPFTSGESKPASEQSSQPSAGTQSGGKSEESKNADGKNASGKSALDSAISKMSEVEKAAARTGGRISGHVYFPDGKPAAGIVVEAGGLNVKGNVTKTKATTDDLGKFEMQVPSQQMVTLSVVDDRWWGVVDGILLRENKPVDNVSLKLTPGTIVEGTITEGDEHRPVAKRRIIVSTEFKTEVPLDLGLPDKGFARPKSGVARSTLTDDKGHYEFCLGAGTWKLDAADTPLGPDSLKATLSIDSQPRIVKDFELPASKTAHLTGQVTDADDKPMADIAVLCVYLKRTERGGMQAVARTNSDGKFDIAREAIPAMLIVQDTVARRAIARIDDKQTEVNVKVVPLPEIHGRLVDPKGAAVTEGMLVCRCSIASESPNGNFVVYQSAIKPDADGKFTFKDAFPGETYKISYGPSERQNRVIHEFKVADGKNTELGDVSWNAKKPEPPADGEKKSSQNEQRANGFVAQAGDSSKSAGAKSENANAAQDKTQSSQAPASEQSSQPSAGTQPGGKPEESKNADGKNAGGNKADGKMSDAEQAAARSGLRISGHVSLPDGKPAGGIKVYYGSNVPTREFAKAVTAADGSYEMIVAANLNTTARAVSVDDDRWAAPPKTGVFVEAGKSIENVDFKLVEGTIVKGTLTEGAENKAVANHTVYLQLMVNTASAQINPGDPNSPRPRQVQFSRTTKTDAAGQYRFCVAPGEYLLEAIATAPFGAIVRQQRQPSFLVKDEREIVQDRHLPDPEPNLPTTGRGRSGTASPDTITIYGTVLDADGKPAKAREVRAVYQLGDGGGLSPRFAPTTADDGTFTLEGRRYPTMLVVKTIDGKQGGIARTDGKQTEVVLHLAPSATGHGQLLDENGKPVSGAAVLVVFGIPPGRLPALGVYYSLSTTAEDGFYSIALLPGEENQLITFRDRTAAEVLKGFEEFDAPPAVSPGQIRGQRGRNNPLKGLETLTSVTPKDTSAIELGRTRIPYHGPTIGAPEERPIALEFHLAEIDPAPGLTEATVADTENKIYLHPEALAEKKDFSAATRPTDSARPLTLTLTLNEAAAKRVATETAKHLGKPLAIVLNGKVISAPRLTSPIGDKAQVTGLSEKEVNAVVDAVGSANSTVNAKPADRKAGDGKAK